MREHPLVPVKRSVQILHLPFHYNTLLLTLKKRALLRLRHPAFN